MAPIDLSGRVAVVTGAGGGIGRAHALLLASRGARVVVNDVGVEPDGSGDSSATSEAVVEEILDVGGMAVSSHIGVETWEGGRLIVDRAIDTWGRIDILVNNAGVLRDVSFAKMNEEQLDVVLRVHLFGGFHMCLAAWPHMRDAGYGRIVNTSSGSGLYGNFGQANYAAAKLGLVGLTRTLAIEGFRYGITAHAIAPAAASRMSETILSDEVLSALDPTFVSALVGYLVSQECEETGGIFTVGGGHVARVSIVEGPGVTDTELITPEAVAERWSDIMEVPLGYGTVEFTQGVGEQTAKITDAIGISGS